MSELELANQPVPERPPASKQAGLQQILCSVRDGNCCRVLGPRYRSKSQLMKTAVAILQQDGTHYTAYQSLRDMHLISKENFFVNLTRDVPIVNATDFFAGLYEAVAPALAPNRSFVGQNPPQSAFEFQTELLRLIQSSDRNLALFIDDLEMAPPNLVAALLGVLQAVYMTVVDQPGPRFQAVVCGSLSFSQLTLESASHFESISDLVLVGDLNQEESKALAQALCRQAGLTPAEMAIAALLEQTGGDRYLIECIVDVCAALMRDGRHQALTPARIDEAVQTFLAREPDEAIVETLKQIQSEPNLLSCTLQILQQGEVAGADLPITSNETPNPLDLCGVFTKDKNVYRLKCPLWRDILDKHMAAAQIGGLYAVAGYWDDAIRFLGQAIREGERNVQSQLFSVVINAIHVSPTSAQAFGFLAKGLQAAYPGVTLHLYRRTEQVLELVYPQNGALAERHIPLEAAHRDEIEALNGPDYSLSTDDKQETNLLIPLRTGSTRTRSLGLVKLGGLIAVYSPYQRRKEVLQFVGFLHQAARAILRAALHEEDERRRLLLEKVSHMTPAISAQLEMDDLYYAVLSHVMTEVPQADNACIVVLDEVSQQLRIEPVSYRFYNADGWYPDEAYAVEINGRSGIAGRVIRNERAALVNDVSQDSDYITAVASTQSQLGVPIKINGVVRHALVLESDTLNAFTLNDKLLLEMLADHVGIAIQNAIQFQAARDRQLRERTAMMATGLIHDINSAVASIPDLVDELNAKLENGRDVSGPLTDLQNSALVTQKVSKKLRDFVITGQQEAKVTDVEELIKNAITISQKQRPPYVQTFYNTNGFRFRVEVDTLWIELMLKNLLVNAYESILPDQKGVVSVGVEMDRENIYIHVEDNGPGIPENILPRIFELGYTTKPRDRMRGIGLYHCQQIAQAHHGDLTVKSTPGEGTCFTFRLPRTDATVAEENGT